MVGQCEAQGMKLDPTFRNRMRGALQEIRNERAVLYVLLATSLRLVHMLLPACFLVPRCLVRRSHQLAYFWDSAPLFNFVSAASLSHYSLSCVQPMAVRSQHRIAEVSQVKPYLLVPRQSCEKAF